MAGMPESESEDEILVRIEAALMKISHLAHAPRHAPETPAVTDDGRIDRAALAHSLDLLIARLRAGLEPHAPAPTE
jgi:hypothetical protein